MKQDEDSIRKVGKCYENPKKPILYFNVRSSKDGWVDASKFLPADFDLCYCKIKDKPNAIPAWHTGKCWDGLKISSKDEVLFWKLNYDN